MNIVPEEIEGILNFSVSATNLQIKAVLRSGKYSIQNSKGRLRMVSNIRDRNL